jgi:hypothetical protein
VGAHFFFIATHWIVTVGRPTTTTTIHKVTTMTTKVTPAKVWWPGMPHAAHWSSSMAVQYTTKAPVHMIADT